MSSAIIADTGVIVGLIYQRDQWNEWSRQQASKLGTPYLTCEPVISEACFLLKDVHEGEEAVLRYVRRGILCINFSLSDEIAAVESLIKNYKNVPMSLADACLVRMSELHEDASVFTVDSDFLIYRKTGRKEIPLISPF